MNLQHDAALIASLLAVDAQGLGGACVRAAAGPLRDDWLQMLRRLLPEPALLRRVPFNIAESRLLGGLDLVASLRAKRPVAERGVLACSDQGVVVVSMAERLTAQTAAVLCGALEQGEIFLAREGVMQRHAARIGIVAFDEGVSDEECLPVCLLDRCAFLLDLNAADARTRVAAAHDAAQIQAARSLLPGVSIDAELIRALCATALALGAGSARVDLFAVRAARVLAALDGRSAATQVDAETAGRLVLAPRASMLPKDSRAPAEPAPPPVEDGAAANAPQSSPAGTPPRPAPAQPEQPPLPQSTTPPQPPPQPQPPQSAPPRPLPSQDAAELVLAATQSGIPNGLLSRLRARSSTPRVATRRAAGRSGALRKGATHGRPAGVCTPGAGGTRLNIIETLRAAAPWQSLRGRGRQMSERLQIRPEDLRMIRYQRRSPSLTIFVVDASGSTALNRLAETKGAAELLLADCYVRRDQVAVIAFRGRGAELLLPPTRSLVRAKRSLSALPGGGGTPLAAAIESASLLASRAQHRGESPTVVMLTDGRGNVARDGATGREPGQADAMRAANAFGYARISALFVDTSPRPHALARDVASRMNAAYFALPFADARALTALVGAVSARQFAARSGKP